MIGAIAGDLIGSVPESIAAEVFERLPSDFRRILEYFNELYGCEF